MGIFKVQGSANNWYMVDFGLAKAVTPSCQCLSWMKSRLLCKHFFAVFRHLPEWGFETILYDYTNQARLTLDNEVIPLSIDNQANGDRPPSPTPSTSPEDIDTTTVNPVTKLTLPKSTHNDQTNSNALARECRETLLEAKNLTYLIQDPRILKAFSVSLKQVVSDIKTQIPADGGLLLEEQKNVKQKRKAKLRSKKKRDNSLHHLPNLPAPKQQKKKHPFSGRVGAKAEMMKKMYQVKL